MPDKPIIMTGESVRAILAGIKTQTRRVVNPQPVDPLDVMRCPYGVPGDTLWVRESWGEWGSVDGCVCYKADGDLSGIRGWHSPMFMPRRASRISLVVKSVRVERVQDISEADAIAEGLSAVAGETAKIRYAMIWDRINAKRGYPWDANPWVWVVEWEGAR